MYLKHCEVESRVEFFKGDIQEIIKSHSTIKKWAYILHDKDDTAPHYHIYLNFGDNGVETKQIASWFGLQESQVSRVKGRSADMLLYLTHGNDSQKNKYQYSPTEVVANFDFETEISNARILGDFEHFSYAQQLEYVNSLPVSEKKAAFSTLEKLWKLHCQCLILKADRKLDVMFIYGRSGAGKTYYAKRLLNSMGLDFCVSSSSNDPFQDYMGQKAIILDDLRHTAFSFEDLLKILDNDTSSSVKSRFTNKVFSCELIVITSTVPINFWYPEYRYSKTDTLGQLYRRITSYVEVTREFVMVYNDGLDDFGKPKGLPSVYKNELAGRERPQAQKKDFGALFGAFLEDGSADLIDSLRTVAQNSKK